MASDLLSYSQWSEYRLRTGCSTEPIPPSWLPHATRPARFRVGDHFPDAVGDKG